MDRIYLNSYVPNLQVGGQVVSFMTQHLGYRSPSPAVFDKLGTAFRRSVRSFPDANQIPLAGPAGWETVDLLIGFRC